MEIIKPNPKPIRLFFFWSGIIATFAYRAIIVINFYSPLWVKIFWYIGTIGFIIYFWHRYKIQDKRANLVEEHNLISAVNATKYKTPEQKKAMQYIIKTTKTTKAKWNSLFIFALSVLALVIGIIMDLMAL